MHANKKIPSFRNTRLIALCHPSPFAKFSALSFGFVSVTRYMRFEYSLFVFCYPLSTILWQSARPILHKYSRQPTLVVSITCESTLIALCKYSCILITTLKKLQKMLELAGYFLKLRKDLQIVPLTETKISLIAKQQNPLKIVKGEPSRLPLYTR